MTDTQEKRLAELKANSARTPEEEAVYVAMLELDEADEALESAIAANPAPDPVKVAQVEVDAAQVKVDAAEAALAAKALAILAPVAVAKEAKSAIVVLKKATI